MQQRRAGFTLVELIIAVGMVLILMTGIVKVFKYATDAVGAGLAVSDIVRAQRATQITIPVDTQGLANNIQTCPAILLDSQQNDPTGAAASAPPNSYLSAPLYLDKSDQTGSQYRLDTFSFFTRGVFTRQTGNDGTYMSALGSTFAWVWYGHIWLPTNQFTASGQPNYFLSTSPPSYPGYGTAASNPNNFYARQWTLGRMAMLIRPLNYPLVPPALYATDVAFGNELESMITQVATAAPPTLAYGSLSRDYQINTSSTTNVLAGTQGQWQVQNARYDLAGVPATSTGDPFQDYFDYSLNSLKTVPQPPIPTPPAPPLAPAYSTNWWGPVSPVAPPTLANWSLNYRFQSNPYPVRNASSGNTGPALSSAQIQRRRRLSMAACDSTLNTPGIFCNKIKPQEP